MTGQRSAGGDALRSGVLTVATITTGLTAGVFVDWSSTIMPGLSSVDDRTFVTAFRALDSAITNPLFLGVQLMGALIFTALAAALQLRAGQWRVLAWVGVALAAYLVTLMITFTVHEPLNERLRAVGDGGSGTDLATARALLDEARWTAWNTVRAVASTTAFGCLTWALAIHRRRPTRP